MLIYTGTNLLIQMQWYMLLDNDIITLQKATTSYYCKSTGITDTDILTHKWNTKSFSLVLVSYLYK